jgi:hypothetical protein
VRKEQAYQTGKVSGQPVPRSAVGQWNMNSDQCPLDFQRTLQSLIEIPELIVALLEII